MRSYIAIAEPAQDGASWWISFPGLPGVTSAADSANQIVPQAQDALASAIDAGASLPPAVEDGEIPSYDLDDYQDPLVVLVPFSAAVTAAAK